MTLLPGVTFVLIIAFLATTVALNVGLVGCPFRFRLGSFVLFVVGTRLAVSCINLYFLQLIIVVLLSRNVPLDLSIRLPLEVSTLLFQLHFENVGVNLNGEICHILQS